MKALIIVENGVEDLEFFYPFYRFKEEGIHVDVAGPHKDPVTAKHGYQIKSNIPLSGLKHDDYDILLIPGGKAPEELRIHLAVIDIVKKILAKDRIVAAICHGAQVLISAGVLDGKKATCVKKIKDDLIAAGAEYHDESVVVDDNLITSRCPDDLPDFCREIFKRVKVASGC